MKEAIGFAGLSHLGIVSSIAASTKAQVIAYDPDEALSDRLRRGDLPLYEEGVPELLEASRGSLKFTSDPGDLRGCPVVYISRDMRTNTDHESDPSSLDSLFESLWPVLSPGTSVVVLSQVRPGFTRRMSEKAERLHGELNLKFFYQVETLIIGSALERALHPERFIVGCHDPAERLPQAYGVFLGSFGCPVFRMRYESAELSKMAVNFYLAASLASVNTLAEIAERIGADWSEIVPALKTDKRIGEGAYLKPGLGMGGGNLERDLVSLARIAGEEGADRTVIDACFAHSRYRRSWVWRVLSENLQRGEGEKRVAIWGLSYKPGTQSTKHSPALRLLEDLKGTGSLCRVRVYDPVVRLDGEKFPGVEECRRSLDALREADILIIMTPWEEFSRVDLLTVRETMKGKVIIDPFGALERKALSELGFITFSLGRGAGPVVPFVPSKKVAGVMLLRADGSLLLQRRDNKPGLPFAGMWSIPSGAVEGDETPEASAQRELVEETGYRCDKLYRFFTMRSHDAMNSNPNGPDQFELSVFWASYDGVQRLECLEGQEIKFIGRHEASRYPMPDFLPEIWDRALRAYERHEPKAA